MTQINFNNLTLKVKFLGLLLFFSGIVFLYYGTRSLYSMPLMASNSFEKAFFIFGLGCLFCSLQISFFNFHTGVKNTAFFFSIIIYICINKIIGDTPSGDEINSMGLSELETTKLLMRSFVMLLTPFIYSVCAYYLFNRVFKGEIQKISVDDNVKR